MDNAEGFMDHLHHGGQAVGGAGGGRQQPVPCGINLLVVDPIDHVEHLLPLHGAGHNHPLHPALLKVGGQRGHRLEAAAALQHHLHTGAPPVHRREIPAVGARDSLPVNAQDFPFCGDGFPPATMDRVEFQQMPHGGCRSSGFVEMRHLHAVLPPEGTEHQPPDAAKAVDANLHQPTLADGKRL